jgi:hypothetical protein
MVRLESVQYPYALIVPADSVESPLKSAERPWDGRGLVERGGPYLDLVFFVSGSLSLYGMNAPPELSAFAELVIGEARQNHQCSEAQNQREVMVAALPAVAFTQVCGASDEILARLVLVSDDFGLVAFTGGHAGEETADIDRLVAALDGLEWTSV